MDIVTKKIVNVRLPSYSDPQELLVRGGKIASIAPRISGEYPTIDFGGDWLSLGGVDLQINGGLGLAFPDLHPGDEEKLDKIASYLWQEGVAGFTPTLVTTSIANFQRAMGVLADYMASVAGKDDSTKRTLRDRAAVLGVHLEGPCLHPDKRGAHPPEYLLPLTRDSLDRVLGDYSSIVKIVTLAPELDPSGETIEYLVGKGITVSLGHSTADDRSARDSFARGATMVTHAFNAMPSLHHREPGLLGAALTTPGTKIGFIADGVHVSPTMLQILLRAGNYTEHLFLVSDALAPLGLPDGKYPWDSREITVTDGTAKLPDGTLSGTTLPLFAGSDNLVGWHTCDIDRALALATIAPRQAIGLSTDYINLPFDHLLRWHYNNITKKLDRKPL